MRDPAAHRGLRRRKVDDAALKKAGAFGVMRSGTVVQVVVGPEADTIASDIEDILD